MRTSHRVRDVGSLGLMKVQQTCACHGPGLLWAHVGDSSMWDVHTWGAGRGENVCTGGLRLRRSANPRSAAGRMSIWPATVAVPVIAHLLGQEAAPESAAVRVRVRARVDA